MPGKYDVVSEQRLTLHEKLVRIYGQVLALCRPIHQYTNILHFPPRGFKGIVHSTMLNHECLSIQENITGAGIVIARLTYTARVDDPALRAKQKWPPRQNFQSIASVLAFSKDGWQMGMPNQTIGGFQALKTSFGVRWGGYIFPDWITRTAMDKREAPFNHFVWQPIQIVQVLLHQMASRPQAGLAQVLAKVAQIYSGKCNTIVIPDNTNQWG
jgi:hypothetical protein